MFSKLILEKYATIVIPKSDTFFNGSKYGVKAYWKTNKEKYTYKEFSNDLVLWIPKFSIIAIEFDNNEKERNKEAITYVEYKCKEYGIEYCLCSHGGKSDYLWIFNIEGLTCNDEKKELIKLLIPKGYNFDWSNLNGLVPIIEMPHWKYGRLHNMYRGKNPLYQKNILSDLLLQRIKENMKHKESIKGIYESDVKGIGKDKIKEIIKNDFHVGRLLRGDIQGFESASHARMSMLFCLVGYGLNNDEIEWVMSHTKGLHYEEKSHLKSHELNKARKTTLRKRTLFGDVKNA